MEKKHLFLCLMLLLLAGGCDLFEYHPYDGRLRGETGINAKNIARIEAACAGKSVVRFVFTGDTQRWYDETEKFVSAINRRTDIDFVIHGGDISDFGLTKEFIWMRDIMNRLTVPYVVLLGNHDCLGNGNEVFETMFGPYNFSFHAGDTKFVCLNTNAIEFDYTIPVPDFEFIESQLKEERQDHSRTIVAMHAPPFNEQFNNNVATVFQRYITEFRNLQFCVNAHEHRVSEGDLFGDGVIYYGSPNIEKRQYLLFTLTPGEYTYEVVNF